MGKYQVTRRALLPRGRRRKTFSLEEANRALPLVRRIVEDIVAQYRQLERLQRRRRILIRRQRATEVTELDEQAARGADRLCELIDEVNRIGCELKDWESGIVDFRSRLHGRDVFLCWRLGEDKIGHWHEVAVGMTGRQATAGVFE